MSTKIRFEAPKTLGAIPLNKYQKYVDILDKNKDAKDDELINLKVLEIFCGLTLKEAYNLKLTDFSVLINHINSLFNQNTPLIHRFDMIDSKGVKIEFGFIPKLDDISLGEFVDLDNYIGKWEHMHKAMAVLYRPVISEKRNMYLIEDYESSDKYYEVMKNMPLDVTLGAAVFFYRLGIRLSKHLMDSLGKEMKEGKTTHLKQTLEENGVGINQFMRSLEVMQQSLKRSQNFI